MQIGKTMRTMLLSFKADVYERVISGEKIYEHRKVFPNEPVLAYLYVSAPVKAITGIMYLNNKQYLSEWKDKFSFDKDALKRINEYLKTQNVAMEISEFHETSKIQLSTLRKDLSKFIVPQMYYFIDDTPLLDYLHDNLIETGYIIKHDFSNITSEQICIH